MIDAYEWLEHYDQEGKEDMSESQLQKTTIEDTPADALDYTYFDDGDCTLRREMPR